MEGGSGVGGGWRVEEEVEQEQEELVALLTGRCDGKLQFREIRHSLREHTHKKLLKSGHCPEGGGGFWACPNCLQHFFLLIEGIVGFFFFLLEYYRGINGALCVISLQFIGFSFKKHSIEIWNINTHPGEK